MSNFLLLALMSMLVCVSLSANSDLATGAEVRVQVRVRQQCSMSISEGFALVRSNVTWKVAVSASDGTTEIVRGGPTDGQRIAIPKGSRVEMVTR